MHTGTVSRGAAALFFLFLTMPLCSRGIYHTCDLEIVNTGGRKVKARVEIADTYQKRQHGLMFRRSLDKNSGMLFMFPYSRHRSFWMKNTYLPLSIAYINEKGIIIRILQMKPLDTSVTYDSKGPARYALEMNQGWFKKNRIKRGCRVLLNGCIGQ